MGGGLWYKKIRPGGRNGRIRGALEARQSIPLDYMSVYAVD